MSATPLTIVAKVRSFTGADETIVPDTLIENFINSAEDLIEEKTGKRFEVTVVTDEVHDGNGKDWMILDHNPIIELTKVVIDNVEKDLSGIYVYHKSGKIVLKSGIFSDDYLRNVKVSYIWGDPQYKIADEIAFNMACLRTLTCMAIKESNGAISERLGSDYTVRYPGDKPYAGIINDLKEQIKDGLSVLGSRLIYGVI